MPIKVSSGLELSNNAIDRLIGRLFEVTREQRARQLREAASEVKLALSFEDALELTDILRASDKATAIRQLKNHNT